MKFKLRKVFNLITNLIIVFLYTFPFLHLLHFKLNFFSWSDSKIESLSYFKFHFFSNYIWYFLITMFIILLVIFISLFFHIFNDKDMKFKFLLLFFIYMFYFLFWWILKENY